MWILQEIELTFFPPSCLDHTSSCPMRMNPIHSCKMRGARGVTRTIRRPRKATRQLRKMARGRGRAILRATRRKRDQGGKSKSYILLFLLTLDSDMQKIFQGWSTICRQRIYLSCTCNCTLCWPLVRRQEGHQHCQINGTRWSKQNQQAQGRQDCQAGSWWPAERIVCSTTFGMKDAKHL